MNLEELPLFQAAATQQQPKAFTVSEITARIRGTVEPAFADVWVQGEISNYRPAASGHVYFSLKDEGAMISAAVFGWGSRMRKSGGFEIKDGMQVLCHGKLSVYPPRGSYQLIIDQIEPRGAGALQLAFEQLKTKLAAEGLFDPKRKRTLPSYPKRVAIVTSPSGAAIKDILTVMHRRAPQVEVLIVPAVVQGENAPEQLIRGLETVNRWSLAEVVVLARGGGSIEDLWCFNDERLARAIAASKLPVISAVGHEIDFTISDFVSDLRAPTPSAAAEILTAHWVDFAKRLAELSRRLVDSIKRDVANRKQLLRHVAARLVNPRDRLREQAQRCDELMERLQRAILRLLEKKRDRVEQFMGKLDALSPLRVLDRGYSLVKDPSRGGRIVRSASELQPGQKLQVTFADGGADVQVL
jgi:exodeoxyribonuclease VII large subunit